MPQYFRLSKQHKWHAIDEERTYTEPWSWNVRQFSFCGQAVPFLPGEQYDLTDERPDRGLCKKCKREEERKVASWLRANERV